ncbi:MAG: HNH endonuclease signature motif containing protein [Candidatus Methanoperedens sp.]|nr:HNH endonuclease signature motif containing protein [Candidatus Methanoperedens sp.]
MSEIDAFISLLFPAVGSFILFYLGKGIIVIIILVVISIIIGQYGKKELGGEPPYFPRGPLTYDEYIHSDNWKNLSYNFRLKANGKCYKCENIVGLRNLESHHRKYPTDFKYDNENNLVALCRGCHAEIHGRKNN